MQHILKKTLLVSALSMAIAPAAYATNGMAPTGVGQIHKAMGGAAVANPQNTMTMGTNPAAGSFIADGYDVGLEIFVPDRRIEAGPNNAGDPLAGTFVQAGEHSGNETSAFLVPEGGYKRTLANGLSLGVVVYGNGGMNTDYKPGFNGAPRSGIDFKQVFISPTISKKIAKNHSVGLSVNLVAQAFKSTGLLPPGSPTGTDTATGIGATVGYLGKISPTAMVGVSHRFQTKMGGFKNNTPLFIGATSDRDAMGQVIPGTATVTNGQMDVPGATTIGLSFAVTPKTQVALDIQRIHYSKVKAIHDGFKWDDQDVIKLGVKHQLNDNLALLGGFNYGESVVPPLAVGGNIIAPAVTESHLSLGFEKKLTKNSKLSVVYMHAFDNTVKGPTDALGNSVALKMKQDSIGIGYNRTF